MATSRPSSRNLAAKPASKSRSDLKRNDEVQNSSEKQTKRSMSSRQSQNHDLTSHESQSEKSQSHESQRRESSSQKSAGCLEILTSEGSLPEILKPIDRPTSGNRAKKAPSINRINSAPRRTPTPTKQITLEAAKRKPEPSLTINETNYRIQQKEVTKDKVRETGQRSTKATIRTKEDEKKDKDDEDDDDEEEEEEEEESSSEEELIKAPNELMMEFLDCLLNGDYVNGQKLCTMILLYEPENAEALSFKSLIEEKMAFDVSNQDDSANEDDDEGDDEDDEDDDEDDSSEDDSDSSETSDDDEVEEEEDTKARTKDKPIFLP